jgi:hypothetical protein
MARVFTQVRELESKYGIQRVQLGTRGEIVPPLPPLTETDAAVKHRRKRDVLRRLWFGSGGAGADFRKTDPVLQRAASYKPNLRAAASSTLNLNSGSSSNELTKCAVGSGLEITVPRMPEVVEGIEKKARLYHETVSPYGHFEWAFSTKEELGGLEIWQNIIIFSLSSLPHSCLKVRSCLA